MARLCIIVILSVAARGQNHGEDCDEDIFDAHTFLFLYQPPPSHEHLGHFGVVVVEEEALACVKCLDTCHIVGGELEIEDVEVLGHAFFVCRFGNDDHPTLQQPAQSHLRNALPLLLANFAKQLVGEETVAAFGQRSPRHNSAVKFVHIFLALHLLVKHVRFHYYAERLHVSPKYLSATVKRVTGHSVSSFIDRATVPILKKYLNDERLSLTQIADRMNFTSLSYFSRYCTKHLGQSPSEYRRSLQPKG